MLSQAYFGGKKLCFSLLTFLISACLQLQAQDLRTVIPPSPVSSEFEKYTSQKVSLANGLPEINIDLYKINVDGVTIPISLSYHASGIKFYQSSGEVGVGWVLNPGYRISRTIYGLPDEKYIMPSMNEINTNAFGFKPKLDRDRYLSNFCLSKQGERFMDGPYDFYDGQYDIFSYNLDNESGNFLISDRNTNEVSFLTSSNRKKIKYTTSEKLGINTFDMTDLRGVKYTFGRDELNNDTLCELTNGNFQKNTTAWPVNKITTPLSQEITFRYNKYQLNRTSMPLRYLTLRYGGAALGAHQVLNSILSEGSSSQTESYYEVYYPREIVTPKETVLFDRDQYTGMINALTVRDPDNNVVKRVKFYYNGYANGQPFIFLDSIRIYDKNEIDYQLYTFDYKNKRNISLNYDPWGYCINDDHSPSLQHVKFTWSNNIDETSNTTDETLYFINQLEYGIEKRFAGSDIFTLNKIVYPTGGYTEYLYENNQYSCDPTSVEAHGPGIRVKAISSYNNWGELELERKFRYGKDGLGVGKGKCMPPSWGNDVVERAELWMIPQQRKLAKARKVFYSSIPNPELSDSYTSGNWGWYDEVAEVDTRKGVFERKTVSKFSKEYLDLGTYPTNVNVEFHDPFIRTYDYSNATLLTDRIYYDVPPGKPQRIVKQEHFDYGDVFPRELFTGLKVGPYVKRGELFSPLVYNYYSETGIESVFNYFYYYINGGNKQLTRQTETVYAEDGTSITQSKEIKYNDLGLKCLEKNYASNGEMMQTETAYTYDFQLATDTDPGSAAIKKMVSLNILDAPVELRNFNIRGTDKALLSAQLNTYMADRPLLSKVSGIEVTVPLTNFSNAELNGGALKTDSRYKPILLFDSYDAKGNLLQQRLQNNIPMSYIWDYNNTVPIAEVKNATARDIAYTSFEADGKGNWQIPSAARIVNDGITGKKCYALQSGSITATGLNAAQKYIVSYWAKVGATVNVSGEIAKITGTVQEGWTYTEHEVNDITTLTVSGVGNIDELRLYPSDAQVNTYTYSPLIGVTSHTSESGKVTYYDFDAFGRLSTIRDAKRNIRQLLNYAYQKNELSTPYKNVEKSKILNRNDCAEGTTGSLVTYVVPAGKYGSMLSQADADAKAQADLDTKAQVYANVNGACPAGYWSKGVHKPFKKQGCPSGTEAEIIFYHIPAAKYRSFVSQADADAQANSEADANGQSYANTNGACIYYNYPMGQQFTKSCPAGQPGSVVVYNVPEKTYSSRISQQDANAKAQADINANGQRFADENGTCGSPNFYVTVRSGPVPSFEVRIMKRSNNEVVVRKEFMGNEPGRPAFATVLPTGQDLYFRVTCNGSMKVAINGQEQIINGSGEFDVIGSPCVVEMLKIN